MATLSARRGGAWEVGDGEARAYQQTTEHGGDMIHCPCGVAHSSSAMDQDGWGEKSCFIDAVATSAGTSQFGLTAERTSLLSRRAAIKAMARATYESTG